MGAALKEGGGDKVEVCCLKWGWGWSNLVGIPLLRLLLEACSRVAACRRSVWMDEAEFGRAKFVCTFDGA